MTETTAKTGPPDYLSPSEVAERYPIGLRTVYELLAARAIDRIEIGKPGSRRPGLRTTAASVERYLARATTHART